MRTPETYRNELLQIAMDADNALDAALVRQYGENVTRWDHPKKEWNRESLDALEEKHRADECLGVAVRMMRLCELGEICELGEKVGA